MVANWLQKRLFSINGYMLVGVVSVLLVSMPFLYKNLMNTYKRSVFEQFETHIRDEAGLLSDVMSMHGVDNHEEIDSVVNLALLKGVTTYIDVIDKDGSILYMANINDSAGIIPLEDRYLGDHDDDTYYLFLPMQLHFLQKIRK